MRTARYAGIVTAVALAAAILAVLGPAPAAAQNRIGFEGRAGVGFPAFDLADKAEAGPAVGLDLTYALGRRVALVVGGDVEFLSGADLEGSDLAFQDLTAWHYGAGVEAQLLDPRTTYWRLTTGVGAGGSTYDADGGDARSTFSLFGSLELGYEVSTEADLFLGVKSWLSPVEERFVIAEADTDPQLFPPPDPLAGVGTAWSFPVSAGVRLHF